MKKIFLLLLFLFFLLNSSNQFAKELLIYADSIDYDADKNLIAKGNAKIISKDEIITSDLIIVNELDKKIILPIDFKFKDEKNNYYYGSSGEFSTDLENGNIKDLKLLLNDGSRLVGEEGFIKGKIDLINKGVYSPCTSKINIKNFICPLWQLESEKILHDRDKLFLYQKHSKMRFFNIPVFYLPYFVTPSPLRKERKSGFLNPSINLNFFDTKTSQSTSLPYYFAISEDKELLLTPTFNYGGGVDASQRLNMDYYQLISGGDFNVDILVDTNFENQNNENWVRDASIITSYNKNLNENYNISIESSFQSSPTYIRRTNQNNLLNRNNSLATKLNLKGYDLREEGDNLNMNISGYQVVRNNEDNKTSPVTLPYLSYSSNQYEYKNTNYKNYYNFYNIFRNTTTDDHARKQQKISHVIKSDTELYNYNSLINFKTEMHSQVYNIEDKIIDSVSKSGGYYRFFPMTGIYIETPIRHKKFKTLINPKVSFIINSAQSNSNKLSNEESTNNSFNLANASQLNRFTGTDKLDNSKRINYGLNIQQNILTIDLVQSYEFQKESDYRDEIGSKDYLSDLIGSVILSADNNYADYNFRFNMDQSAINNQSINLSNTSKIGTSKISYFQEKKEANSILVDGKETLDLSYESVNFLNYSKLKMSSKFDLINDNPTNYNIGYEYIDDCFGLNVNFDRSFYEDRDLKPQDNLTLMFLFKHLGSYKSTNLAVSETDKQDIRWISQSIEDEYFN